MLYSELKEKEVINIKDCKKLGNVCDLEFDECSGCILKIMVPGNGILCNLFCTQPEYIIPYKDIRKIGPDIILVEVR